MLTPSAHVCDDALLGQWKTVGVVQAGEGHREDFGVGRGAEAGQDLGDRAHHALLQSCHIGGGGDEREKVDRL